jgi:hypothetical protein
MNTHIIHTTNHAPWTDDEAERALGTQRLLIRTKAQRAKWIVNAGWFVSVALITYAFLRLNHATTESSFYASLLAGGALAYMSALGGTSLRDENWLLEDWKLQAGAELLTSIDVHELRQVSANCEPARLLLHRWSSAGSHLRERDRRVIDHLLRRHGFDRPERPSSLSDLLLRGI